LKKIIQDEEDYENELENEWEKENDSSKMDESADGQTQSNDTAPGQSDGMDVDSAKKVGSTHASSRRQNDPAWTLQAALGTEEEQERWKSGDIAAVYEDTLRMLLRLQGEGDITTEAGADGNALATTVGKVERAGRAAEVVENMMK
jgi:kinetochor protein Mis14/NSL1